MLKLTHLKLRLPLAALCLMATASPALALDINLTFASNVSTFGANTNSFTNAVAYAAQQIDNAIIDPITINITVNGSAGTGTYGGSNYVPQSSYFSYTSVRAYLIFSATQPAQQIAVATLPVNDPSPGGPNNYVISNGAAKALGILTANGTENDGSVTFGAGYNWSFEPGGGNDFNAVALHELSEAMGRSWGLGNGSDGQGYYVPYDLYRYDGGTTTRDMTNNTNVWFSINGGGTQLNSYNYNFTSGTNTNTEDPDDFGSYVSPTNNEGSLIGDPFTAYGASGNLTSTDMTVFNVMGFHLSAAAMSGGTWAHQRKRKLDRRQQLDLSCRS